MMMNEGKSEMNEFQKNCYGCEPNAFLESVADSVSGPGMALASLCSDAQHLMTIGSPDALEEARMILNRVKLMAFHMLQPVGGSPKSGWTIKDKSEVF